jgi:pimeloyl-ACP methyl ester carboxylesterase
MGSRAGLHAASGSATRQAWHFLLACFVAASLVGCAWIDAKQRQLIYRPTPGRPADFAGLRPGDLSFLVDEPHTGASQPDHLQLFWLPNADPGAPTLLYLHGTFRSLYQNLRKLESLRTAGFSVLGLEYRGWGDSTALLPSESTIYADANVAWNELVRRQPDPLKRVIYGHSMGSGVAVELASHRHYGVDYGGLILESSFTSLPGVARANGTLGTLASWLTTQEFDSLDKIAKVDAPILMMHGSADHTVPVELGRQLFAAAPAGARWVEFAGGSHSGLDIDAPNAYRQAVSSFIDRLKTMQSPSRAAPAASAPSG